MAQSRKYKHLFSLQKCKPNCPPKMNHPEKITGKAVIPVGPDYKPSRPYGVFDPCIWRKDETYYALSGGITAYQPSGRHIAAPYLFRSSDLKDWEFLHPFLEGDRFTRVGDDISCPYFWPIGDRHILLYFSHLSGGHWLLGDYDQRRDKFVVDAQGDFNFGATFPSGVHAPTAFPDGTGGVITMFNMNPGKPTDKYDGYLSAFFDQPEGGTPEADAEQYEQDWDQILTLPRRLTLRDRYHLNIEPAGDIESLRTNHRHLGPMVLPANQEVLLDGIGGSAIEIVLEVDTKLTSMFEIDVLRAPNKEEFTRICFYSKRGFTYREPFPQDPHSHRVLTTALSTPVRNESVITVDSSYASTLPDVLARPPESAPVFIENGEPLQLRVFVDRSVVEVFANGRQCVAVRVYPGCEDSTGVSLLSQGQEAELLSFDCWQLASIYDI
ncbi:glycoside hydrolase family 32 protein [Chloroflexi bacterium TSY]|nr:glycoside hydrolase family 32 protein [Chloroflexi bacterium TSY]